MITETQDRPYTEWNTVLVPDLGYVRVADADDLFLADYLFPGVVFRVYEHGDCIWPRIVAYVSVYKVHRCYGGPEEGGWYYDAYEHICSMPLRIHEGIKDVHAVMDFLRPRFKSTGDLGSVAGGDVYDFYLEAEPGENQTRERPRYE